MVPRVATAVLLAASLAACGGPDLSHVDLSVQGLNAERRTGGGGFVALDVLLTDADGAPIGCEQGLVDVSLEVAPAGSSAFVEIPADALEAVCNAPRAADVAIVADNSKSELEYVDEIRRGAQALADDVLAAGGRVSVVRVATEAKVLAPLTADAARVEAAIDSLYVTNGWSALYDGIRQGNETLGGGVQSPLDAPVYDDVATFCDDARTVAVVAFTDGDDNNSNGQMQTASSLRVQPGDGIDTTLEDLYDLRTGGITTPVYSVGVGYWIDRRLLEGLANHTGGRHLNAAAAGDIVGALVRAGEYVHSTHRVCGELPERECGDYTMRVTTTVDVGGGDVVEQVTTHDIHVPCDVEPTGRTATMLLTLGGHGVPRGVGRQLAQQTARWVSPVLAPDVLVVLDDAHRNEMKGDASLVASWLDADRNVGRVDYAEERAGGLSTDDLAGYDVVWFSNPGYPMNDRASFDALQAFSAAGGGVVLQGDDMGWSWGNDWSMAPLTHADWQDNGIHACDHVFNNGKNDAYTVTIADERHPLLGTLAGTSFTYADDIDRTVARGEGEAVLATAHVPAGSCASSRPALIAFDPVESP